MTAKDTYMYAVFLRTPNHQYVIDRTGKTYEDTDYFANEDFREVSEHAKMLTQKLRYRVNIMIESTTISNVRCYKCDKWSDEKVDVLYYVKYHGSMCKECRMKRGYND